MAKNLILAKAQNAVLAHDWVTAARLYKELLRGNESNVDYLKELGSIYVKAGEDEKAIPYYEQIITFYPHYIEAMNSLGAIYRRLKRYEDSINILQRALDEGRNTTAVYYNLGFTYKEMGNNEDAIDAFETVIAENPDDVLAYNHLGSIYFVQKNYEKSIASFRRGLQVDPNHPILNYNLARCYEADKNYTDAIRYYETSLRTRPGWADAIRDFSSLLIKCQDNKKAQDLVEKSIKLHPRDVNLLCLLGKIFINQFDYDNAAKTYKKADSLKGHDVKILTCLSEALEKNCKVEQALEKVMEALDIDPQNNEAKKQYIHSLLSAQRYDLAYENVNSLNQDTQEKDLQVLDLFAQYFICRGDEQKASEYHSKIQKINHHYKDYMLSASDRYVQIGNLEKAEDFAKQFVERRATLPDGYNRLGEIAAAKGDYKTARAHYEKGLQMTYPNVQASRGLAKVNAELERNPELINYETPVIEVDAEKMEEEEDYVPSSFIGEAVEAESELPENAEEDNVDIDHFGDSVPMGEALLDDENNFWEEFDDDPDREPVPMADEENAEEEDSLIDKDMLDSFGDSSLSLAESLAEDEENPFDFSEFDDANQGEEIENAPVTEPEEEQQEEPPLDFDSFMPETITAPSVKNDALQEPVMEPQPVQPPLQPAASDPVMPAPSAYMQSAAMDAAGSAIDAAVMAQKMAMQITEQQREFEKNITEKNEKLIKEAVNKAVEEKMQKSMDDQMERIMAVEEATEEVPVEVTAEKESETAVVEEETVPEDDFELPLNDDPVEVEVKPIESIMNPETEPVHDEMDDFLSAEDFAEEDETEAEDTVGPESETAEQEDEEETSEVEVETAEQEDETEIADTAEAEGEIEIPDAEIETPDDDAAEVDAEIEIPDGDAAEQEDEFTEPEDKEESAEVEVELTGPESEAVEPESETVEPEEADFAAADEVSEETKEVEFAVVSDFIELEAEFAVVSDFTEETPSVETAIAKIEEELSKPEVAAENAEQIELFKTLRVLSSYLPENQKDSFLSCRIRMIIEYIIAKMSGKPGLLITAESLLKSGVLGEEYKSQLEKESEEELSNSLICHVLNYMKTLAQNLQDEQLSKALCISADTIIEQIELENQKSQIF